MPTLLERIENGSFTERDLRDAKFQIRELEDYIATLNKALKAVEGEKDAPKDEKGEPIDVRSL